MIATISELFRSYGIDPLIGGFISGIVLCAFARIGVFRKKNLRDESNAPTSRFGVERKKAQPFSPQSSLNVRINVNGEERALDAEEIYDVIEALKRGDKIEAIKRLREKTGLGLSESKQLIEVLERTNL